MFPICGIGHNGSQIRNLFSFSFALLDIQNVSEMYRHFTIISETEKAKKLYVKAEEIKLLHSVL